MLLLATVVCSVLFSHSARADDHDETSIIQMEKHQIVPDVIDTLPTDVLEVKFGANKVDLGNVFAPTQVKEPPSVSWKADTDAFYTLCMTDPDAPSRKQPANREWHHWLVINIPGNDIKSGEVLSAYVGSAPPKGSGLHRYVLLVYKQPGKLTADEPRLPNTSGKNRAKFSIAKFAKKYNLGNPVAGNFYQAEWDEHSEVIYKQLAG